MELRSHSFDYQRISQGSSRFLALYCLGLRETQREAAVSDGASRPGGWRQKMQQMDSITKLEGSRNKIFVKFHQHFVNSLGIFGAGH
jgi:hypothetical protein